MIDKPTHRHILYQLIKDIFTLPEAKYLAFKGGTMAYFFHQLPRFSTDIDLDLLHPLQETATYEHIATLAQKYGRVTKKKHLLVSYKEWYDHIKIDLSRKKRTQTSYTVVDFYGTSLQVQDRWSMVAHKLVACLERQAPRDFFDIWYFLSNNFPIHTLVITERTWRDMPKFREQLFIAISTLPRSYKFLDGLGELVDQPQKTFIKEHLRDELLHLIQFRKDFR